MEWRSIPGVELLEVTQCGKVRRPAFVATFERNGVLRTQARKAVEYAPYKTQNGYLGISVKTKEARKKYLVHRLVGFAWVPGHEAGLTINHIDGQKLNNHASNLEWVTSARNSELEWETGLVNLRGDNHPSRKLSSGKVRIIRDLLAKGASCNQLAVLLDLSPSLIFLIRDGKRWSEVS